jgi:hypothetical protein
MHGTCTGIKICKYAVYAFYVHVTVHRDMWPCIVTCNRASWHVTVHRDMWPCIVTCNRAPWHATMHRDMWPCIATWDRASRHVTVHRDMWPCIVTNFLINKTRCTNCSNLFWNETLHVSGSSSVHHQEWFTVQQDQDGTGVPSWSCSKAVYKSVWHIPMLCVQWINPDDGQRNCPKYVEFHSKIKFEKISPSSWFYYNDRCVLFSILLRILYAVTNKLRQ